MTTAGPRRNEPLFNPVVLLAVASETAKAEAARVSNVLSSLRRLTVPKLVGYKQRPWGIACGTDAYTDAVPDLMSSSLFKSGYGKAREVGFHLFTERWHPVPVEESD